jgi:alanyl-tRNA synthetase
VNLEELASGLAKTELLYLRQTQLATVEVNVVRVVPEKKTHAYLILDKTIFHPKGGGQPSDHGVIRSPEYALNLKKAIYHKGVVVHWGKIMSGTPSPGRAICELDWSYRYPVMRRHTAAHLLDHCLATVTSGRVETTDSWLDEPCYVGYVGEAPGDQALSRIQDLANTMISAGGRVQIDFLTGEQSKSLLQSAPNFERLPDLDEVRTVTIAGCEPIPCGGTHVSDISEIGRMSVVRAEQLPNQSFRLHFSVQP